MNKTELEVELLRHETTVTELAEKIGLNRTTLYRKMASGKFDRAEIIAIRDALGLTDADMLRIFFNARSCENVTNGSEKEEPACSQLEGS